MLTTWTVHAAARTRHQTYTTGTEATTHPPQVFLPSPWANLLSPCSGLPKTQTFASDSLQGAE